jgi:hypothetical protein
MEKHGLSILMDDEKKEPSQTGSVSESRKED